MKKTKFICGLIIALLCISILVGCSNNRNSWIEIPVVCIECGQEPCVCALCDECKQFPCVCVSGNLNGEYNGAYYLTRSGWEVYARWVYKAQGEAYVQNIIKDKETYNFYRERNVTLIYNDRITYENRLVFQFYHFGEESYAGRNQDETVFFSIDGNTLEIQRRRAPLSLGPLIQFERDASVEFSNKDIQQMAIPTEFENEHSWSDDSYWLSWQDLNGSIGYKIEVLRAGTKNFESVYGVARGGGIYSRSYIEWRYLALTKGNNIVRVTQLGGARFIDGKIEVTLDSPAAEHHIKIKQIISHVSRDFRIENNAIGTPELLWRPFSPDLVMDGGGPFNKLYVKNAGQDFVFVANVHSWISIVALNLAIGENVIKVYDDPQECGSVIYSNGVLLFHNNQPTYVVLTLNSDGSIDVGQPTGD